MRPTFNLRGFDAGVDDAGAADDSFFEGAAAAAICDAASAAAVAAVDPMNVRRENDFDTVGPFVSGV
jgi:hypothetical protein